MALIDDHEVEEVRLKQCGVVLLVVIPDELLIQGEVHLIGRDAAGVVLGDADLVDGLFQRREVLLDGLANQHVAVGEVQDFPFHAAAQQPVDDLERGVGLARARRHDEQNPVLPAGDGVQRAVHGDALIVAGRIGALARIVRLADDCLLRLRQARAAVGAPLEARVQLVRRRKVLHGDVALDARQEVVLPEGIAVRAVRKGNVEHLRIRHGLLQPVRHGVLIVLGLDNRNRVVRVDVQHIVRPLRQRARHQIAPQIDLSIGDLRLHRHPPVPLGGKRRCDEVELDVLFGHLPLGNDAAHPRSLHKVLPDSNRLPVPEDCITRPYRMFILLYHNGRAATSMDWIRFVPHRYPQFQCPAYASKPSTLNTLSALLGNRRSAEKPRSHEVDRADESGTGRGGTERLRGNPFYLELHKRGTIAGVAVVLPDTDRFCSVEHPFLCSILCRLKKN